MITRHLMHLWRQMKIPRKNQFFSSPKTSQQSVRKPNRPLLLFNSPWKYPYTCFITCLTFHVQHTPEPNPTQLDPAETVTLNILKMRQHNTSLPFLCGRDDILRIHKAELRSSQLGQQRRIQISQQDSILLCPSTKSKQRERVCCKVSNFNSVLQI